MSNKQELYELLSKIGLFIIGVALGLAAKLATLNKTEKLTFKVFFYQTSVALAAAWAIWHLLMSINKPDLATGASVVVGRFADNILLMLWRAFKSFFKQANDDIQKTK